jgi:uncharacterized protein (TIGR02246 family)
MLSFRAKSTAGEMERTATFPPHAGKMEEAPTGKELRFRTAREFLRVLPNRSEGAPCRELDAEEVDDTIMTMVSAWNRHDIKAWAGCFTQDADYVNVVGAHWQGRRQIEEKQLELHNTALRNSIMRASEWTIRFLSEATCLVHVKWEMWGTSPKKRCGMLTLVLVPVGSGWNVAAAHNSDAAAPQSLTSQI